MNWWPFHKPIKQDRHVPALTTTAYVEDGSDPRIPRKDPDVLVELGREMAASLLAHPEKYAHALFGNQVLVVDNATYDALFYLFSGTTRDRLWDEKQAVAALFLGRYCVMSRNLFESATNSSGPLGGWGAPF